MPAPKGHPPYPGCERGGQPPKYTKEDIDRYADEFKEWWKNPENVWYKDFCLERDIDPDYMSEWAKINEKFKGALKISKPKQESRIINGSLKNKYNSAISKLILVINNFFSPEVLPFPNT